MSSTESDLLTELIKYSFNLLGEKVKEYSINPYLVHIVGNPYPVLYLFGKDHCYEFYQDTDTRAIVGIVRQRASYGRFLEEREKEAVAIVGEPDDPEAHEILVEF